jgi:hypothetical protein
MTLFHANADQVARRPRSNALQASRKAKAAGVSLSDYMDELEEVARYALARANAIKGCPLHADVTLRVGNAAAEREADALAGVILRNDGAMWMFEDLIAAIKDELDRASDGRCPACDAV